ncbi:hypothetical protein N499_0769A, partial [Wolbachia pipientis wVitA]
MSYRHTAAVSLD